MAENKMEQVAAMFGKALGEEFTVKHNEIYDGKRNKAKFTEKGFYVFKRRVWNEDLWIFFKLLTGEAVIVDD